MYICNIVHSGVGTIFFVFLYWELIASSLYMRKNHFDIRPITYRH